MCSIVKSDCLVRLALSRRLGASITVGTMPPSGRQSPSKPVPRGPYGFGSTPPTRGVDGQPSGGLQLGTVVTRVVVRRLHGLWPHATKVPLVLRFLQREFTLEKAASKVLWTILFAALTRAFFWLLGISLEHKELWYWIIVPAVYLSVILAFTGLARGSGPQIVGEIEWMSIGDVPPQPPGFPPGAMIVLIAIISNRGDATSLEGWALSIQIEGQKRVDTLPYPVPEALHFPFIGTTLKGADALHIKLAEKLLGKGERVRGLLMFDAAAVSPSHLGKPGQVFTLSVEDYQNRRWSINYTWKAQMDISPRMFSGMTISSGVPMPPEASTIVTPAITPAPPSES